MRNKFCVDVACAAVAVVIVGDHIKSGANFLPAFR